MSRHLVSVDAVDQFVKKAIAEKFGEDVIDGRVIHNVETNAFCLTAKASAEFRAEAIAAYARLIEATA